MPDSVAWTIGWRKQDEMLLKSAGYILEEQKKAEYVAGRGSGIYFNEYSTTMAEEGGTIVELEIWTVSPVRTLRPDFRSEAISE